MSTEKARREVRIIEIRHGRAGYEHLLYGKLADAATGEHLICATLEYIIQAVKDRDYRVVV